ncbi:MAG: response regulator [Cyanobacteriota bacterium]|nr:response regulator [Cyanobacteriota bacterium]
MPSSESPKPDLLIVDDRADNLQVLSKLLRERYRVRITIGGEIALQAARAKPPDLILLDILMPRMDGYEVCEQLKRDPRTRDVPVLFLSALARGEDKVRGFEVGGADYITKPFQAEEVIARIEHQLAIRTLQRQLDLNNQALAQRNRQLEAEIQQRQIAERDLQQRNAELEETLSELQTLQREVIHREKMTALGRLSIGIAGEINDPLTVIRSAMHPIRDVLDRLWFEFPAFFENLSGAQKDCFTALIERAAIAPVSQTKERRKLKRKLNSQLKALDIIDADARLASILAELGVDSDLESMLSLLTHGDRDRIFQVALDITKASRSADNIEVSVERADRVLKALGNYAGRNFSETPAIADITEGLELVLSLFRYRIPLRIQLVTNYSSLPLIQCYPNELSQVWTNLIENSLLAMGDRGTLKVETTAMDDRVRVFIACSRAEIAPMSEIDDNPNAHIDLYICEKIIQKHNGTISLENDEEQMQFTISLPIS